MDFYGAGLRISAVVALTVTDIDSKRMLIRVEQGKGRKDRHAFAIHARARVDQQDHLRRGLWSAVGSSGAPRNSATTRVWRSGADQTASSAQGHDTAWPPLRRRAGGYRRSRGHALLAFLALTAVAAHIRDVQLV
jgi:integrase